jgi:hypothetical protein
MPMRTVRPYHRQVRRWTTDGLLGHEQATAILAAERSRVPRPALWRLRRVLWPRSPAAVTSAPKN